MKLRDRLVITLGNFMHEDRSLRDCLLVLADFIAMGILMTFLGMCIFG